MYSRAVVDESVAKIQKSLKIRLTRYSPEESRAVAASLADAFEHETGERKRDLRRPEADFILNERLLFANDFEYALRYIACIGDQGGLVWMDTLWDSQRVALAKMAALEERNLEQARAGKPSDGILIADHKGGRQLGHTAFCRAVLWHRLLSKPHTRAASVSVDEPGIHKVFEKDELLYTNVPRFLTPALKYHKKDAHFGFEPHGSHLTYYQAQQRSGVGTGIGTGATYDVSHMTEVATYAYPDALTLDFFPTLPQNPYTTCILETTAYGRANWWRTFSEAVRQGRKPRWAYLFIPFYAEPTKYRRSPPEGWEPNPQTQQMAAQVLETSHEFVGKRVDLSREHLYWWESSYNEALETNELNRFLSNYAITPQQSFQFSGQSAFSVQVLDKLRVGTRTGAPYDLEVAVS